MQDSVKGLESCILKPAPWPPALGRLVLLEAGLQINLGIHPVERHGGTKLGKRNLIVDSVGVEFICRAEPDGRDTVHARRRTTVG